MLVFKDPRPYVLDISRLRSVKNVPLVSGLFHETARQTQYKKALSGSGTPFPTFCLDSEFDILYTANKSNPEHYYWSMRRLYLEAQDPNEYEFAKQTLGSWDHWLKIQENATILSKINEWRAELQTLLTSEGCKSLIYKARDGDVNAAKFIATKKWQDVYERVKDKSQIFSEAHEVQEDFERLKLVVNK